jgi:hypothetical protein
MNKTKADYWAPRINAEWRKSVEGILGVGRQLIAAKEACEHGEFLRLFKGHENAVSEPLPFSENTSQRLMAVASHEVLSNAAHVQHLPQSWGTLYELTKLDDEQIVAGIKAGEITAEMTRAEASALRADPAEQPGQPLHEKMADDVEKAFCKSIGRLESPEQFSCVRHRLERLLEFLAEQEADRDAARQAVYSGKEPVDGIVSPSE